MDPEVVLKGKQIIHIQDTEERAKQSVRVPWVMPPAGALKLNIDGAFLAQSGQAGAGMILRRSDGTIVFAACRSLRFCLSALDSEISACMEGVKLALDLSQESILVETDCLELVSMVRSTNADRSCFGHLVEDLRHLFSLERIVSITKISRDQNYASHELARFAMLEDRTGVWLGSAPDPLLGRIHEDCNNIFI
jgi:ribonuclease HI